MHVSTSLDPGPWPDRIWWQCAAVDIHLFSGCFQLLPCLCGALLGLVLDEHYTPLATRLRWSMLHCMSVCQWTSGPKARLLLCVSWHWDLTPDALVRQQSWNTALWQASGSGRHVPFRHRQSLKCCGIPVTEHQSGTRWFWMSSTFVFIWCSVKQTFGFKALGFPILDLGCLRWRLVVERYATWLCAEKRALKQPKLWSAVERFEDCLSTLRISLFHSSSRI